MLGDQATIVHGAEHELARVQGGALAAVQDPALDLLLDRSAQRRFHECPHRGLVEAMKLEPLRAAVLPQRDDRVRARLARAQRGDHEHVGARRQVLHECGRGRVEELGVVDANDDSSPRRAGAQRVCAVAQEVEGVLGAHRVGQQAGERPEGDHRRAAGGLDPFGHRACTLERGERLAAEARLARARLGPQHDAAAILRKGTLDRCELRVPADERPLEGHRAHESNSTVRCSCCEPPSHLVTPSHRALGARAATASAGPRPGSGSRRSAPGSRGSPRRPRRGSRP